MKANATEEITSNKKCKNIQIITRLIAVRTAESSAVASDIASSLDNGSTCSDDDDDVAGNNGATLDDDVSGGGCVGMTTDGGKGRAGVDIDRCGLFAASKCVAIGCAPCINDADDDESADANDDVDDVDDAFDDGVVDDDSAIVLRSITIGDVVVWVPFFFFNKNNNELIETNDINIVKYDVKQQ